MSTESFKSGRAHSVGGNPGVDAGGVKVVGLSGVLDGDEGGVVRQGGQYSDVGEP